MTLAITLGKATYNWRDAFTGMKTIYEAGGLYHFNQRVPLSVDGGVPPTLRRARHIPVPHHVQNLKWFKQCMRNHWISFRNATWSQVSRNSRSIHSIHITITKKNRDIQSTFQQVSHPAQRVETSSHSFGAKVGFLKGFTTVPVAHEVGAGATNTGGAWIHSQVQGGWRKITRFLSFFKSGGMTDPRFGNRFFWSSIS